MIVNQTMGKNGVSKRPEVCVEEKHRAVARIVRQLRGCIKGGKLRQGKKDGKRESCRPGCGYDRGNPLFRRRSDSALPVGPLAEVANSMPYGDFE